MKRFTARRPGEPTLFPRQSLAVSSTLASWKEAGENFSLASFIFDIILCGEKSKEKNWPKKEKKANRDSDRARVNTRVNLGWSLKRWRESQDLKEFETDSELTLFLLDRYVICLIYLWNTLRDVVLQSMEV